MSKITDIKAKITELEGGAFQELCDAMLSRKGYEGIHSYGLHSSSMKTTKGNPDTYFKSKTGNYIFVMYTTQQSDVFEKAKEDINKCLDSSKTGILEKDIEEIIFCHTSSNLSAGEDKILSDMCKQKNILFSIYGVDSIADEIYRNCKVLAKDHLGLTLDTNQILEKADFVSKYDSNVMLAPLSTVFQFRQKESQDIFSSLKTNNVICVIGKSGVGKTRLALEVSSDFASAYEYKFFCVKSMDLCIFEDISSYMEKPGKYLFLIDDANELIGLKYILEYVNMSEMGYDVKVILTLRDYTAQKTILDIKQYAEPHIVSLTSFTDEETKNFLDVNLEIRNSDYVEKIIKIAEGNPRIAYMAGKLVKTNQSISAIDDATQLYENYYDTYLQNSTIVQDRDLCLTAGIISLLHTVNLENLDCLVVLFDKINITKEIFISMIHKLCEYEYVEIQLDKVAIISDQCLRNYMLYYVFFNKRIIPFAELLEIGFKNFRSGIINTTSTLWNVFSSDEVQEYLQEEIGKVWNIFKQESKELFYEFIKYFRVFNLEETLLIAKENIEKIKSDNQESPESICREKEHILKLLSGYRDLKLLPEAVDLICEYVIKVPSAIKEVMDCVKIDYSIDKNSHLYDYYTANCIFDRVKGKIENQTIKELFLELAKHFVDVVYRPAEVGRGRKIIMYTIPVVLTKGSEKYRSNIWEGLISLCEKNEFLNEIEDILMHYSESWCNEVKKDLFEFDKNFVAKLVDILWKTRKVSACIICGKLKTKWNHYGIDYDDEFHAIFQSELWKIYNMFLGKALDEKLSYEEEEKKKKQQITSYSLSLSDEKIKSVIAMCDELAVGLKDQRYIIDQGLEIFAEAFSNDESKLIFFIQTYMDLNLHVNLNPCLFIEKLFKFFDIQYIYDLIWNNNFSQRDLWKYAFFERMPLENITKEWNDKFLLYLEEDDDKTIHYTFYRSLRFLDNYLNINPEIYCQATRKILKKQQYSSFIVNIYLNRFFNCYTWTPEEMEARFSTDINLLKQVYFYIINFNPRIDYNGAFIKYFISMDNSWLELYTKYFYENIDYEKASVHSRLVSCWDLDNYVEIFDYIFNFVSNKKTIPYSAKFAFRNLLLHEERQVAVTNKQENWILNIIKENSYNSNKITFLFEVLSELGEDIRRKAICLFVQINKDYNIFSDLPLEPNHWGGTGSMIPCMKNRIEFLKSLLPYFTGIDLLEHKIRIQGLIKNWEVRIKNQEVEELMESLYQ